MAAPDVSVVIVSYNVRELLEKCLRSLFLFHHNINLEVIIVDNASVDDTIHMIQENFPDVNLIANTVNAGFPKANNQAFEIAQGEYVFMLNPDTEFFDNAIEPLKSYLDDHSEIALIAPKLLNTDGSLQNSVWRFPTVRYIFFNYFFMDLLIPDKYYGDKNWNEPFLAESFSGAAIFFRKEILKKLKGLDESLFWIEDIDFCYRAYQEGYKLLYFPSVEIIHHIGGSGKKNYRISISNQIFNKIKYYRKHNSFSKYTAVVLISFFHVLIKTIVLSILAPFRSIFRKKASAYWYTLPKVFNPPKGIR